MSIKQDSSVFDKYVGRKFNNLTVISFSHYKKYRVYVNVLCDCGASKILFLGHVRSGHTKSCGCLWRKHGHTKAGGNKSKLYRAWRSMIGRCYNPNVKRYEMYGARGVSVCERWLKSFKNFLEDMGEPPSKNHSLDRINNDGNYEPNNCRWADAYIQANNKRRNVFLEYNGKRLTLSQWDREAGFKLGTVQRRIYANWGVKNAIETPIKKTISKK